MKRIYQSIIETHFSRHQQMLFLAGPRQVGKTTLTRQLGQNTSNFTYLNWDDFDDQRLILSGQSTVAQKARIEQLHAEKSLIVFDEIHKYPEWKNFIKGFYDKYAHLVRIIITGSAQLDAMRQTGDSLMGRYFLLRIHPLSVAELLPNTFANTFIQKPACLDIHRFEQLKHLGGFPDPFLNNDEQFYRQWRQTREQQLLREDIRDLSRIHELSRLHVLLQLLKNEAGQLINYSNLSTYVGVGADTIKQWISLLSGFYYCFELKPYTQNVTRTLRKNPKIYLWDWAQISDIGQRHENMVACHLLKAVHFWTDLGMGDCDLFFLRDKEKREVDFLITRDHQPWMLIEVKSSASAGLSPSLAYYQQQLKTEYAFQVAMNAPFVAQDCFQYHQPLIVPGITFLSQLV